MSDFMSKLRTVRADKPPRIVIYGPPGKGKTTLAGEFPNPYFMLVEDGLPEGMEVLGDAFASYQAVLDRIGDFYNEEHDVKTLVIDTLDKLEPLIWAATCEANNWANIETPGFGKGYVSTGYLWRDLLDGLNALRVDRGMTVILLAHSDVERFDDPRTASYSQFQIRLHKSGRKLVEDEADAILFLNEETILKKEDQGFNKTRAHAEGNGGRFLYCEGRPAFIAKNRFGMPDKIPYRLGQGYAELSKYLARSSAEPVAKAA